MSSFKGKTAIVTGAGRGIGKGCAAALAEKGANVVLADIDFLLVEKAAKELTERGFSAKAARVDVGIVDDLGGMVDFTIENYGTVDILINNAGIYHSTPIEDITENEWDRLAAVNLKSVFFASQKVLPYMKEKKYGKIVNLSSIAGRNGGFTPGMAYSAAKAGIIGLTRGMASKMAPFGININAVAPGSVDTGIMDGIGKEALDDLKKKIPFGRLGEAGEIVACILFLCSDDASFVTGAVLDINGGAYFG